MSKKAVIYTRVSSHDQKGDLERQKQSLLDYAKSKGYEVIAILEDVASGLNENRKSLNKIFDMVEKREVGTVIIVFKDRLTRFGFKYDAHQELVEDLLESSMGEAKSIRRWLRVSRSLLLTEKV